MRPRVFPAEDDSRPVTQAKYTGRFNEAAGIPRGRPTVAAGCTRRCSRFNEAAGIPRGRLVIAFHHSITLCLLQ